MLLTDHDLQLLSAYFVRVRPVLIVLSSLSEQPTSLFMSLLQCASTHPTRHQSRTLDLDRRLTLLSNQSIALVV